jgi:hypothetical protein
VRPQTKIVAQDAGRRVFAIPPLFFRSASRTSVMAQPFTNTRFPDGILHRSAGVGATVSSYPPQISSDGWYLPMLTMITGSVWRPPEPWICSRMLSARRIELIAPVTGSGIL